MITNAYTGSLGTDPLNGCINREIIRFKIYVAGNADDPSLKVECSTQIACLSGVKDFDNKENTFELTNDGLTALNKWLDEQYKEYLEKQ